MSGGSVLPATNISEQGNMKFGSVVVHREGF